MENSKKIIINLKKHPRGYTIKKEKSATTFILKAGKIYQKKEKEIPLPPLKPKKKKEIIAKIPEKKKTYNISAKLRFKQALKQKSKLVIPSSSIWFDIKTIHKIEKESLPEFFQMSNFKTTERYVNLRNTIIAIFYQNSDCYLTATNCLQIIGGDCCSIIRVHHFLEHWGLINFFFDIDNQDTNNCSIFDGRYSKSKKDCKLDLFDFYEKELVDKDSLDKKDFLEKLVFGVKPFCDFCGDLCGIKWYEEKIRKKKKNEDVKSKKENFKLCIGCYDKRNFPSLYIKKDFRKIFLLEDLQKKDDKEGKEIAEWDLDKKIKILDTLKETNFNLKKIKEIFKDDTELSIIKNILKIPFENFKNFNKISSKNFEMIFKKNDKKQKSIFDNLSHNPITKKIAFLKILLDKNINNDEKMNESFILHDENNLSGNTYPTNLLLKKLLSENHKNINLIKNRLLENSEFLIKKSENKIIEQIQNINFNKFRKLKRKLEFIKEYEKLLLNKNEILKIKEDDILVATFLKKRSFKEFEL